MIIFKQKVRINLDVTAEVFVNVRPFCSRSHWTANHPCLSSMLELWRKKTFELQLQGRICRNVRGVSWNSWRWVKNSFVHMKQMADLSLPNTPLASRRMQKFLSVLSVFLSHQVSPIEMTAKKVCSS